MRALKLIVLIFLNISVNNAIAEDSDTRTMWFSSESSILLNRSSHELASEQIQRGIRFAEKALKTELTPEDEWIAHYNLCMAYTISNASLSSNTYCQHIGQLNRGHFFITTVRGVLRIQRIHPTIDLVQAVKLDTANN